jgi:hypothetical protein
VGAPLFCPPTPLLLSATHAQLGAREIEANERVLAEPGPLCANMVGHRCPGPYVIVRAVDAGDVHASLRIKRTEAGKGGGKVERAIGQAKGHGVRRRLPAPILP